MCRGVNGSVMCGLRGGLCWKVIVMLCSGLWCSLN